MRRRAGRSSARTNRRGERPIFTAAVSTALAAALLLTVVAVARLEGRRLDRAKARFRAGRSRLSDAEFLARAGSDAAEFLRHACKYMADLCGVEAELIRPDDPVETLLDLQGGFGSAMDFVFAMERHAGVALLLRMTRPADGQTFAEYVGALEVLVRAARRADPTHANQEGP